MRFLLDLLRNLGSVDFRGLLSQFSSFLWGQYTDVDIAPIKKMKIDQKSYEKRRTLNYARGLLLAALALSSCGVRSSNVSLDLPLTKQKQKIIFLQKKLELAEREEKKIHAEIERLGDEMRQTQLALIRKQVDEYEEQIRKQPKKKFDLDIGELFLNERDQLHRMIQSGASIYEAQIVLDRILQLITELSDELY